LKGLSHWKFIRAILGGATSVIASALLAPSDADAQAPHTPPAEAYAACQSKNAGDTCGVKIHNREIMGTCASHPSDGRLFCLPDRPPPSPAEAFSACDGKSVSDACTVQIQGRSINGTCMRAPDSRLFCVPPRPAGAPDVHVGEGGLSVLAFSAW
jgi:hypothetical protein